MRRFFPIACLLLLTCPLRADPPLPAEVTRFAFGSCLRQERPAPILDKIVDPKPDLFVWLGDNIYGDSDDPAVIKAKYDQLGAIEGLRKLRAQTPFLYVWDDHDYGKNDAGAEYAFKDQNKRLMLDFFNEPQDSERRRRAGNYDAKIIGPEGRRVQFILLDTRSFRSPMKKETRDKKTYYVPTDDANATVLGEAQWTWLEAQLKQPAEVRIIATSIQLIPDQHRFEKWANFPKDRQRLLDLLAPIAKSTVIISGDRHHGSVHKLNELVEVTASSLNQSGTPTAEDLAAPTNLQRPIGKANFGEIRIQWNENAPPTITHTLIVP